MRIVNLRADNIKKLTAIDITPTTDMIEITGKNGAGKSSILDSIVMALCGGRAIPEMPIKKGADKGKITMDIGEYIVTRSFTKENSYLKIEGKDGAEIKSPQKFLDNIVGNISFDPLDFLNNEGKVQRDILLQLIGVDVKEIDEREKKLREERARVGRERDQKEAALKGMNPYAELVGSDMAELSFADLAKEMQEAMEYNASIDSETVANETLKREAKQDVALISSKEIEVKELQEKINALQNRINLLNSEKTDLEKSVMARKSQYLAKLEVIKAMVPKDVTQIQKKMGEIEELNKKIRGKKAWRDQKDLVKSLETEYDALSRRISEILTERNKLLSEAKMPVKGLSFDDNGLTFNGVPLEQASDGEKLMVSLGISMALNPKLRVLRIKDGSLLDEENRAIIRAAVKDQDYQLWFESVGTDAKVGILIEEGEIVKVDGVPQQRVETAKKRNKKRQDEPTTVEAQASTDTSAGSLGTDDWPEVPPEPTPTVKPEIDW